MMTLNERILADYAAECPLPENATPFQIYATGWKDGLKAGQVISQDVLETMMRKERDKGFKAGNAHGIGQAAYIASHTSTVVIDASMGPGDAAAVMRESITAALIIAENAAKLA